MNYIFSKKKPEVGDRGFIIGNRFIPIQRNNNNIYGPVKGLVFYASLNGKTPNTAETGQVLTLSNVNFSTIEDIPCFLFSGTNSSYISCSDNTGLPLSNQPSTLSCWFRLKDTNNTNQIFFAYGSADENKMRGLACAGGSDRYACSVIWGANGDNKSSFQFEKDVWYHVCCTFDADYQKLYLNSSLIKELNYSGMNTSFEKISMGGYFYVNGSTLQEYANCYIASARIYDRALTEDEITQLANEFVK